MVVGLARQRTEELLRSLVQVRQERDASKSRLQELEGILSTFKEEYNPNFNDEGVKRAVRAWEDYALATRVPKARRLMIATSMRLPSRTKTMVLIGKSMRVRRKTRPTFVSWTTPMTRHD